MALSRNFSSKQFGQYNEIKVCSTTAYEYDSISLQINQSDNNRSRKNIEIDIYCISLMNQKSIDKKNRKDEESNNNNINEDDLYELQNQPSTSFDVHVNHNNNYSRHNDEDIDINSHNVTMIDITSIKNISRDNDLRHYNIQESTTKKYTTSVDYKVSKEQTSEYISQNLLDSSSKTNEFVFDLPFKMIMIRYIGNMHLNQKQNSRNNKEDIDTDSKTKFINNTSIQRIFRDKDLRHDNLYDPIIKNCTIEFDDKLKKEQTFQSISQDLLDSSHEATGFVYELPLDCDHDELQKQLALSSNGNFQSNVFLG